MAEPVETKPYKPILQIPPKDYILDGCKGRAPRVIKTLILRPEMGLVTHNEEMQAKYRKIEQAIQFYEEYEVADAEIIISAYGIPGRIAKGAVKIARKKGIKVGLIRPISLWPFPKKPFMKAAQTARQFLVVEMSQGQFIEDVKLAMECRRPVEFLGKGGGWYPTQEAILDKIEQMLQCPKGAKS
jgi:2-oxoglutarate ferredoxin oxidoreductase subunit alpha